MSASSRVLVLGSHGLLGSHVVAALRESAPGRLLDSEHPRFTRGEDLGDFLAEKAPTTVINCIGYAGEAEAELYKVNACFPRVISDVCHILKALFIHISTNAIFASDSTRRWLPGDHPEPRTPYEVAKAMGEDPRAFVIRSSFIGASRKGRGIFNRMAEGHPYADRYWNGVTALALARRIAEVARSGDGIPVSGLEHVFSQRVVTFQEIATLLGSTSEPSGEKGASKLLGGGQELPDIREQLEDYARWLQQRRSYSDSITSPSLKRD